MSKRRLKNFFDTLYTTNDIPLPSINQVVRVFVNCPGNWGTIPGQVIPKTQKMVLDAALLNTQHYKVWIKGKVEQSKEKNCALLYTLVL